MSHTTSRPWWRLSLKSDSSSKPVRKRKTILAVERLEVRDVPTVDISGTVMQTLNVAGLFPKPSSTLFGPVSNVTVLLDGGSPDVTDVDGKYSFSAIPAGAHTVSIQ